MCGHSVCLSKMVQVILSGPQANWHSTAHMHRAVLTCPQDKAVPSKCLVSSNWPVLNPNCVQALSIRMIADSH